MNSILVKIISDDRNHGGEMILLILSIRQKTQMESLVKVMVTTSVVVGAICIGLGVVNGSLYGSEFIRKYWLNIRAKFIQNPKE